MNVNTVTIEYVAYSEEKEVRKFEDVADAVADFTKEIGQSFLEYAGYEGTFKNLTVEVDDNYPDLGVGDAPGEPTFKTVATVSDNAVEPFARITLEARAGSEFEDATP